MHWRREVCPSLEEYSANTSQVRSSCWHLLTAFSWSMGHRCCPEESDKYLSGWKFNPVFHLITNSMRWDYFSQSWSAHLGPRVVSKVFGFTCGRRGCPTHQRSPEQRCLGGPAHGEGEDVLSHRKATALQRQNSTLQQLLLPKEGYVQLRTAHTGTAVLPVWECIFLIQ